MKHAHKIFIRTKKEDSAFMYAILEASEGLAAYTTLIFDSHDPYRDLELLVPEELLSEVNDLLTSMSDIVTILPENPSKA
ncbi:MAG: hypothetical protein H7333_01765 [Bdellovibrionales bacterium]|nr:hypothetical protein [Oligoflexia bacterium]